MFLGFYTSNITKKNQLTFPNKFKRNTGQKLLLAKWFEKSVIVLPENIGEEIIQSILKETSALLPEHRDGLHLSRRNGPCLHQIRRPC